MVEMSRNSEKWFGMEQKIWETLWNEDVSVCLGGCEGPGIASIIGYWRGDEILEEKQDGIFLQIKK